MIEPEMEPTPEPPPPVECRDETSVLEGVNFENNSDALTGDSINILETVIAALRANAGDTVRVLAHTDSNGSEAYNQDLSDRRARSVMQYLIGEGIDASRLSSQGFGESRPIAENGTATGRAQNRRVELVWTRERCSKL